MVAGRAPVVEWLIAKVVSEAVDSERALLNRDDTENTSVDKSAFPISPAKPRDQGRHDPGKEYRYRGIVLMLPADEGVVREVGDVGAAVFLVVLVKEKPAHVCVPHYGVPLSASRSLWEDEQRLRLLRVPWTSHVPFLRSGDQANDGVGLMEHEGEGRSSCGIGAVRSLATGF